MNHISIKLFKKWEKKHARHAHCPRSFTWPCVPSQPSVAPCTALEAGIPELHTAPESQEGFLEEVTWSRGVRKRDVLAVEGRTHSKVHRMWGTGGRMSPKFGGKA